MTDYKPRMYSPSSGEFDEVRKIRADDDVFEPEAIVAGALGSGAVVSGNIASGQIGVHHLEAGLIGLALASGNIQSGHVASGAVPGFYGPTRAIQSGTVGGFDLASGAVETGRIGSGAVRSGNIASGSLGANHLGSGAIRSGAIASGQVGTGHLADGAVQSGDVASGNIGRMHLASGAVNSGHINTTGVPDGSKFLRDDFTWAAAGGGLTSGAVQSGHVASGTVGGFYGVTRHIQSGTVGGFDLGSGAVETGRIGSGAVQSGQIASGAIGANHTVSGVIFGVPWTMTSGQVRSGHIASGAISTYKIASGADITKAQFTAPFVSGTAWTVLTAEIISGARAVTLNQSGQLIIAMASVSGRMPARGIVVDNVLSGVAANVYTQGPLFQLSSGMYDYSGYVGQQVFVGRSGHIATFSGSFNSGGLLSGDVYQYLGMPINSGAVSIDVGVSIATTDISAFFTSADASGIIQSGNIASGAIGTGHLANGAVTSGDLASGQVGRMHLASGAVNSGHINTTGTPDGTKFLRDDFSWTALAVTVNSGDIGSGHIASGAVDGFFGVSRRIQSGTVGVFDFGSGAVIAGTIGSGAVQSGNVASGQLGTNHFGSGAIISLAKNSYFDSFAAERLSGAVGVSFNQSGNMVLANPFTAAAHSYAGIVIDNVESGAAVRVYTAGAVFIPGKTFFPSSGRPAIINASGEIIQPTNADFSGYAPVDVSPIIVGEPMNSSSLLVGRRTSFFQGGAGGWITGGDVLSGAIKTRNIASGGVLSGNVGSGQIGNFHVSSGAITSGRLGVTGTPDGTKLLRDDFTWVAPGAATINSGDIGSGKIASGAVDGFFGVSRRIQSGTVGVFDLGSGAVIAGTVGSGAIQSGNIASGQIGPAHISLGSINQNRQINSGIIRGQYGTGTNLHLQSGTIGPDNLGSGAVVSGAIASGNVGLYHLATIGTADSTTFLRGDMAWVVPTASVGSGGIGSGKVASGTVGGFYGVTRHIQSGTIGDTDFGSGMVAPLLTRYFWSTAFGDISGDIRAVQFVSGGGSFGVEPVRTSSGVYQTCVGAIVTNAVSGDAVRVVTYGPTTAWIAPSSGTICSGFDGATVFGGSGGIPIFASGTFAGGDSSGGGAFSTVVSGTVVHVLGHKISGGVFVNPLPYTISLSGHIIRRRGFLF